MVPPPAPCLLLQVVIAWLWAQGLPCNPRTMNATHMAENLAAIAAVQLDASDLAALSSRPLDYCAFDSSFYECVPGGPGGVYTPPPPQTPFATRGAAKAATKA
jgi:hypothetical protein